MTTIPEENKKSLAATAWKDFIHKLDEAGQNILGELGAIDSRERAEGFRYLTRLISIGLDMHLEHVDAAHPTFTRIITDTRKFVGDNPDTEYDYVTLEGSREYRITGKRGVSTYLAFCTYGKNAQGNPTIGANLSDAGMQFEADGSFEILIGASNSRNAKNFLCINNETTSMMVRQYFLGDRSQRGTFHIEALTPAAPPAPYSEEQLFLHLNKVGDFVKETSQMSSALSIFAALNSISSKNLAEGEIHSTLEVAGGKMVASSRPTAMELAAKIDQKAIAGHMPTPDIQYSGAWWELKPGEAVVIEGKPIQARYWSIQIFNRWLESPDYRYSKVAINSGEVQYEADGSFVVVLAPENHHFKNWISTDGFTQGQVCFRALIAESAPQVTYRIEKISNLAGKA